MALAVVASTSTRAVVVVVVVVGVEVDVEDAVASGSLVKLEQKKNKRKTQKRGSASGLDHRVVPSGCTIGFLPCPVFFLLLQQPRKATFEVRSLSLSLFFW